MIPYYGFEFAAQMFSKGGYIKLFACGSIMNMFVSVLLSVLLFMMPENWFVVGNVCRLAILNVAPSFLLLFVSMAYHYYEGGNGKSLFLWPLFVNGGS